MPTKLIIIHAKDFITATAQGALDFEESKKALVDIATAAGPLTDYEILLDTRKVRSHLSTTDLWHLAAELAKLGLAFKTRTAVLCPLQRFDDAEFFSLCAQNRGLQVRGFTSFEEAITWLTETPDSSPGATAASASLEVCGQPPAHTAILWYERHGEPLSHFGAFLRLRVENQLGFKIVKGIELIEWAEHLKSIHKGVAVVVRGLNSVLAARAVAMARKIGRYSHKSFLIKVLNEMIGHQCFEVTKGWLGPLTHWFRPRHAL